MITAIEFLTFLRQRDLIDPALIDGMRERVEQADSPVPADKVLEHLVAKGLLSDMLAKRLLEQAESTISASRGASSPAAEMLGLAPDPDEQPKERTPPRDESPPLIAEGLLLLDDDEPAPSKEQPASDAVPFALVDDDPPVEAIPVASVIPSPTAPAAPTPTPSAPIAAGAPAPLASPSQDVFAGGSFAGAPAAPPEIAYKGGKKRRKDVWDSKLLILGVGGLLVLVILGAALVWRIFGYNAEELMAKADEHYRAGAYSQAIVAYEAYIEAFPGDCSLAKVRLSLARMRQIVDGGSDWPAALAIAKEQIPLMSGEEEFAAEGRPELNAMLPTIAEELANRAFERRDPQLVADAEEAVTLVERYVLVDDRPARRMSDIRATIQRARHAITKAERLAETLAAIETAIQASGDDGPDTVEGYALRDRLIDEYPELLDNAELTAAAQAVSEVEAQVVAWDAVSVDAVTEFDAPTAPPIVTLAVRDATSSAPVSTETIIYAQTDETLYGLHGDSGRVAWRRPRRADLSLPASLWDPIPIAHGARPGALLVSDERTIEFIDQATGRPIWSQALEAAIVAPPLILDDALLAPLRGGLLARVELTSGRLTGIVRLPQPCATAPIRDDAGQAIYVLGEHSTLFILSAEWGRTLGTLFLGHEAGMALAPPTVVGDYLLVFLRTSAETSELRVHALVDIGEGDEKIEALTRVQTLDVDGVVDRPIQLAGDRALFTTTRGDLTVLKIDPHRPDEPVRMVAEHRGEATDDSLMHDVRLTGDQVWVAGDRLTQFDIQAASERLTPRGSLFGPSVTWQPPRIEGRTLFHVRRDLAIPGVIASAVDAVTRETHWRIRLDAGPAAAPIVDAERGVLTAVTSCGALYELTPADLANPATIDRPTDRLAAADLPAPVSSLVLLPEGRILLVALGERDDANAKRLAVYDPSNTGSKFRRLRLPSPLAARPCRMGGGVLLPCASGELSWIDPKSAAPLAESFLLPTEGAAGFGFGPAATDQFDVFLAGGDKLRHVRLETSPSPHLKLVEERPLDSPVVGRPVVWNDGVYVPMLRTPLAAMYGSSDAGRAPTGPVSGTFVVQRFSIDGRLMPLETHALYANATGEAPLPLQGDVDRLLAGSVEGAGPSWIVEPTKLVSAAPPLEGRRMAWPPVARGDTIVAASASGELAAYDASTGVRQETVHVGRSIGAGPVEFGGRWIVPDAGGSLFAVELP